MNKFSESLLASMNAVSNSNIASQATTITIEAQITEVLDRGIGLYKVKYLENYFNVYSNNDNTYNVDENVYVIVPNGDFSKEKFIIGTTAPSGNTFMPTSAEDEYIEISDNLLGDLTSFIELSSYIDTEKKEVLFDTKNFSDQIVEYLNTFNTFGFSCKIKTDIAKEQQVRGNYGLKLILPIIKIDLEGKEIQTNKEIILDTSNISGSPYALQDWSNQNIYINFDSISEKYDDSREPELFAFVENFTFKDEDGPIDIWIKDLDFRTYEVLTIEQMTGYHLTVKSDSGNYYLTNSSATKTLKPYLKVNGKDTNYDDCACYWFREDATVSVLSDKYNSIGGIGWACLNQKTAIINSEGVKTYSYVTNEYNLKVQRESFYSVRYKCVIIYGDKEVVGYITLTDLTKNLKVKLSTSTPNNTTGRTGYTYVTCQVDLGTSGIDPNTLQYVWTRYNKNNDYLDNNFYNIEDDNVKVSENIYKTRIYFDSSLIDSSNTICCSVYSRTEEEYIDEKIVLIDDEDNPIYDENGEIQYETYTTYNDKLVGTSSIIIFSVSDFMYYITWENSDVLYKYDSDGDSPFIADYDGPNSSRLNATKPLRFRIFDKYGNELTENQYKTCLATWTVPNAKNSMIEISENKGIDDEYIDITARGKVQLSYSIAETYNSSKTNNTILLKVQLGDYVLSSSATISFLKDGESGTNGTRYSAIILYNDGSGLYSLNQRDENGVNHNAKIMYLASSNDETLEDAHTVARNNPALQHWYIYNYENGKGIFKQLDIFKPSFSIELYKDGKKVQNFDENNVSWSWYDRAITKPCFEIVDKSKIITKEKWSKKDDVFCNILQARIRVTNTQEGTDAEQYIYAYYPIEISRVSNIGEFASLDGNAVLKYDGIVPSLVGGFYSVLYSADGKNPKYDASSDFKCVDNIFNESEYINYKYNWSTKEPNSKFNDTLKISNNTNADIDENLENVLENASNECRIRPVSTWLSGQTKNFVKVELKWDEEIANIHQQELDRKNLDYYRAKAWENYYKDFSNGSSADKAKSNREDLKQVLKVYFKDSLKDFLNESRDIVEQRLQAINITDVLFNKLENWKNYLDYYISGGSVGSGSYVDKYDKVYSDISTARQKLIQIADSSSNLCGLVNSLKDLSRTTLEPDSLEKKDLGDFLYNNLKPYIDDFQNTIVTYNSYYNKISHHDSTLETVTYLDSAESFFVFKDYIRTILNLFEGMATPKPIRNEVTGDLIDIVSIVDPLWINNFNKLTDAYNKIKQEDFTYDGLNNLYNVLVNIMAFWSDDTLWIENEGSRDEVVRGASLSQQAITWFDSKEEESSAQVKKAESNRDILIYQNNLSQSNIIHIRPILFKMNNYEMSNINAWDGNKIYLDGEGDGAYILAPQMGAGTKNDANQFTGMVMGIRNMNNGASEDEVGLYGYKDGISSFELDAKTGSAKFGTAGTGQIILEPGEEAKIYGGNYNYDPEHPENGSGMEINLTDPYIKFGTGYFEIDKDGRLKATEATISGSISADIGSIGGWIVTDTKIHSDVSESNGRLTLNSKTSEEFALMPSGNYAQIISGGKPYYHLIENYSNLISFDYQKGYNYQAKLYVYDDEFEGVYDVTIGEKHYIGDNYYFFKTVNSDSRKDWLGQFYVPELDTTYTISLTTYNFDEEENRFVSLRDSEEIGDYMCFDEEINTNSPIQQYDSYYGYRTLGLGDDIFPGDEKLPSDTNYPETLENYTAGRFKKAKLVFEQINYSNYKESSEVYCRFEAGSGYEGIFPIERGNYINGIWEKDLANGLWFKIEIRNKTYYSFIYYRSYYSGTRTDYVLNPFGDCIKIGNTYYTISNFYWIKSSSKVDSYWVGNYLIKLSGPLYNGYYEAQRGELVDEDTWIGLGGSKNWQKIIINGKNYYTQAYGVVESQGIYSYTHSSYLSENKGFYLGSMGLSLGSKIRFGADGDFKISNDGGDFLTSDLYLGSQGMSLGRENFVVDSDGYLSSKIGSIGPFIYDNFNFLASNGTLTFGDENNSMSIDKYNITKPDGDRVIWKSDLENGTVGGSVRVEVVYDFPQYYDKGVLYVKKGMVREYTGIRYD